MIYFTNLVFVVYNVPKNKTNKNKQTNARPVVPNVGGTDPRGALTRSRGALKGHVGGWGALTRSRGALKGQVGGL